MYLVQNCRSCIVNVNVKDKYFNESTTINMIIIFLETLKYVQFLCGPDCRLDECIDYL